MIMRQLVSYQFLPARKPAVVRRLLSRLPQQDAIAVLDLEDSAADAVCPERNMLLKANSRSNLDNLFDGSWQAPLPGLGIRINAAGTAEHLADLELAAAIQQRGYTIFLMLPKVEQAADVLDTAGFFATRGLPPPRFLLLAETGTGIETLGATLAQTHRLVDGIVLGMIDYCHEQRIWPFYEPLDPRLWAIAGTVAEIAAAYQVTYVHTPCPLLKESASMREIYHRLLALTASAVGMLTLSHHQTISLLESAAAAPLLPPLPETEVPAVVDRQALAHQLVSRFEANYHLGHSFAVDPARDRFIPPQEYLSALRFLEGTGQQQP